MPATPEQLQSQIDALHDAMAGGVLTVEYQGRKLTYRSLSEMRQALALLKDRLADATGETHDGTRRYAAFHRGYLTDTPEPGA